MANELSEMIAARDSMARYYINGHCALRAMMENRNDKSKLTFRRSVNWARLPVSEIEELINEVYTQVHLIKVNLTNLDGYMYRNIDANNQMQNIGTNAPNSDL